jgi:DNA-binding response OmpR family regulator
LSTILIAEDDAQISALLARGLRSRGFNAEVVGDGDAALKSMLSDPPDLLVLDLGLPGKDGLTVLRELRAAGDGTPVVILTASEDLPSKLAGFEVGADDYVTKPFLLEELVARIRARLRAAAPTSQALSVGGLRLDLETRWVSAGERRVELSAREFALLETFMRDADSVLTRELLLARVWGFDYDPASNVVEVYVGYLRRKLGNDVIETVRGSGYRFRGAGPEA